MIALAFWVYFFLFGNNPVPQNGNVATTTGQLPNSQNNHNSGNGSTGSVPASLSKKISSALNAPVSGYWFYKGELYYLDLQGRIFKASGNGDDVGISNYQINDILETKTSQTGRFVLVVFRNNLINKFSYFDLEKQKWDILPEGVVAADFNPKTNEVALINESNGKLFLFVKDLEKNKIRQVAKLNFQDVNMAWVSQDKILLTEKSSTNIKSAVWSYNLKTKTLADEVNSELGLDNKLFVSSNSSLRFKSNSDAGELALISNAGSYSSAPFLTLPSKCLALSANDILCAAFKTIPNGLQLPDDYLKRAFYSDDEFDLWNLKDSSFKTIKTNYDKKIDAEYLKLKDTNLYFVNRYDNKLYSLDLSAEIIDLNLATTTASK